ncbi:MAG: low molecular weight protein-tyrosine-phosphatase [Mariprofundaceae bacterium]|nr:low molecular weight protein-tyrosine-phosphatase [Mariprofundaceae bacterium]
MDKPIRVLFVCLGNICRSPLAEVIAKHKVKELSAPKNFHFESAGTGNWHIGGQADPRSANTAQRHGLDLSRHTAQQITHHHIHHWDYLVAMDHDNRLNLLAMGANSHQLLMMRQFESEKNHTNDIQNVPDPYYGGEDGFEDVYQMLNMNIEHLLNYLLTDVNHLRKNSVAP